MTIHSIRPTQDFESVHSSAVIPAATSCLPSIVWHRAKEVINRDPQVPGKLECSKHNGQTPSTPAALETFQVHC